MMLQQGGCEASDPGWGR